MKTALYASAAALVVAASLGATAAQAQSRDTIQIAGSSTVLPFASIVAEEFGATFPEFNTPVVEAPGDSADDVQAMLVAYGMPADPDASQLVDSLITAFDQWTLTDAQHAVVLEMLEAEDGVSVLGATTDRLGRPVYALSVPAAGDGTDETVLISTESGRIVGVETEQASADGIIPEGAVVMYNLWI